MSDLPMNQAARLHRLEQRYAKLWNALKECRSNVTTKWPIPQTLALEKVIDEIEREDMNEPKDFAQLLFESWDGVPAEAMRLETQLAKAKARIAELEQLLVERGARIEKASEIIRQLTTYYQSPPVLFVKEFDLP